jgi:signal transduction histidine kinase
MRLSEAVAPDIYKKISEYLISAKSGKFVEFSYEEINSDGVERTMLVKIVPQFEQNKQIAGFFTLIEDITDQKAAADELEHLNMELEQLVIERTAQLEEALEELKFENFERKRTADELLKAKEEISEALEKEKELNELKSRFISTVSHEYRTPLTVIMSSTFLLEEMHKKQNFEKFGNYLFKIKSSVRTMTRLLEDILIIGKSEAGKLKASFDEFDLAGVCNDIVEEIAMIDEGGHRIVTNFDHKPFVAALDKKFWQQIVSNLLSNAIKYSPADSSIELNLSSNNNNIVLRIADKGKGIPENEIKSIFEPFFRGSKTANISGTGLGLSIVKRCVDAMNGKISCRNRSEGGAEFEVKLPR